MRFYYSLYGRGGKGMLDSLQGYKFSESVLAVPVHKVEGAHKVKFGKLATS
jgi:hypothetical protein